MIKLPKSISGRLLFWQTTGVTVILLTLGIVIHAEIKEIVVSSMDRALHSKARIFTGLLHNEHGTVKLELSDIIAGEYVIPRSGHYYKVLKGNNILAASPSLADESFSFVPQEDLEHSEKTGEYFFNSVGPANEPVRVLQYRFTSLEDTFVITLAETMSGGITIVDTFRGFLLILLPIGILLLCFTAWRITRTALAPLADFTNIIETITHRNMEERLMPHETAQELSCLATSFNSMLDRLHHVFVSQKRLLADASHELKTPLAVIRTQCDVALLKQRSVEEYCEAISEIRSESQHMTQLVNDLLSLARLDAGVIGSMKFVSIDLQNLISHAIRLTDPLATRKGVRLSVSLEEGLKLYGVQSALEEAILNLVENAIRYNHAGGEVQITATGYKNGNVAIAIHDSGIGIGADETELIFERFYRSAAVRGSEGSGLGLSIVKSIVEAHDGQITVASEPGKWSRFTLIIPAAQDGQSA